MMRGYGKRKVALLAIVATALLVVLGAFARFTLWEMNAHGAPESKLMQLHHGMNFGEVRTVLGKPKQIRSNADGSQSWVYDRMTWCHIRVDFSADGKVTDIVHDH